MKVIVIGGTGLIGTRLGLLLRESGHEVAAASASTGVNILTGEGVAQAVSGAQVVVDVTNSPSFEDAAVLDFFTRGAANLLPAERAAGVQHHIALSVVGASRMPDSGYMRAKVAQEQAIEASGLPYTILRATQFFEFLSVIAAGNESNGAIRVPPAWMQPVAAGDVAATLAGLVEEQPANGVLELAGPERLQMGELFQRVVQATGDPRPVVVDEQALYFGARITGHLVPAGASPRIGSTLLAQWFASRASAV